PVTGVAVDNGVVYLVGTTTLSAFDAAGKQNCVANPYTSCDPLWTANLGQGALPFAPVVADGKVFLGLFGPAQVVAFDSAGVTNCSGAPKVCTPLWSVSQPYVTGAPAVSAVSGGGSGRVFVAGQRDGADRIVAYNEAGAFLAESTPLPGVVVG